MQLGDAAAAYLTAPTAASIHALRTAITAEPTYTAGAEHVAEASALVAAQRFDEAVACLSYWRRGAFFSPSTHRLLTEALRATGQAELADYEEQLSWHAIASLLESGDGSRIRPYLVLRVSDEYDVLEVLEKSSTRQAVEMEGGRVLDVFECEDGSEVWFELFRGGRGGGQ